jgi:hypothetical protein
MKMQSNSSAAGVSDPASHWAQRYFSDRLDPALKKHATHLTATLSFVVGVSGTMMFFHLFKGKVQGMHEWFGMAFLLAFLAHIARNRRPFLALFSHRRIHVLLGISALTALGFFLLAPPEKTAPSKALAATLARAPIASLAPALGLTVEQALARITAAGGVNASADSSIEAVAASAHLDAVKLLNAVLRAEAKHH